MTLYRKQDSLFGDLWSCAGLVLKRIWGGSKRKRVHCLQAAGMGGCWGRKEGKDSKEKRRTECRYVKWQLMSTSTGGCWKCRRGVCCLMGHDAAHHPALSMHAFFHCTLSTSVPAMKYQIGVRVCAWGLGHFGLSRLAFFWRVIFQWRPLHCMVIILGLRF